jgi:hypothetical protein
MNMHFMKLIVLNAFNNFLTMRFMRLACLFILILMAGTPCFASRKVQFSALNRDTSLSLPYYDLFASAGLFRNGRTLMLSQDKKPATGSVLLPIPVLVGKGISSDMSRALFFRAMQFHFSGYDEDGAYTFKDASLPLPESFSAIEQLSPKLMENLYAFQLSVGNCLVADSVTYFPLLPVLSKENGGKPIADELKAFRNQVVYYWAAAYPWCFHEFPNETLKDALLTNNAEVFRLFVENRFLLNENQIQVLQKNGTLLNSIKQAK